MLGCGVEHSAAVHALDSDDTYLYSAGADAVVLVWDLSNANAVREISMPSAPVRSLLRVSHSLWLGLSDGSVEVLDIFGDDTNGIARIAHAQPHAHPVTSLVRVGETHVWSVAEFPAHADLSLPAASNVAVWDTRDCSYIIPDDLPHPFLRDVTVLEHHPFDRVTILTLTPQLEPHYHLETVPAMRAAHEDPESEALHAYVQDLEQQLDHATEELHFLRAASIMTHSDPDVRASNAVSLASRETSPTSPVDLMRSPTFVPASVNAIDRSPEVIEPTLSTVDLTVAHPPAPIIPSPVLAHLEATLTTLAELLVALLTDDVLAGDSTRPTASVPNSSLRHAVAAITQELNAAKGLLDSCATPAPSESDQLTTAATTFGTVSPSSLTQVAMSEGENPLIQELRDRLDAEVEKSRRLERDLAVVTRERDLGAEELTEANKHSDATMTSLQAVLRDNTTALAEKDELIGALREECASTDDKWRTERLLREDIEASVKEQIDKLIQSAKETANTYEEQITAAYDKIEIKSIEIQAQRDTIQATEVKIGDLRSVNLQLEEACGDLQMRLKLATENSEQARILLESERAAADDKYSAMCSVKENLENVNDGLQKKLLDSRKNLQALEAASKIELEEVKSKAAKDHQMLRDKTNRQVSDVNMELEREREEKMHMCKRYEERVMKLESEIRNSREQIIARKVEGDRSVQIIKEQADAEIKCVRERSNAAIAEMEATVRKMSARLNTTEVTGIVAESNMDRSSLAEQYRSLSEECELLKEELEHRKSATLLYEEDSANMATVVSNLRAAAEELKETLDGRDEEVRMLTMKIEELKASLQTRERRIDQLESRLDKIISGENRSTLNDVEANGKATRALLASAHGEIEQMSKQMDTMYRSQIAMEKELTALRKAVSTRDETIRRRDAALDALRRTISDGLRARASDDDHNIRSPPLGSPRKDRWHPDGETEGGATARLDDDGQINATLQELQEGMVVTQDKLRHLMQLARKCKTLAHSHVEVLPALFELEGELARINRHEPRKGALLKSARGIVQSVIAQYYSSREKRAVMNEQDEALYAPSEKRLAALQAAVARLRVARLGEMGRDERDGRRGRGGSGMLGEKMGRLADRISPALHNSEGRTAPTTKRLITF